MGQDLFVEIEFSQCNMFGEDICGDSFLMQKIKEQKRLIAVLSDGLGHGVKAGILSTMTASMALKFIASDLEIGRSAEIMMDALPVCQKRQISYATFSIFDYRESGSARIIEMDNPGFMHIRQGELLSTDYQEISSPRHQRRKLRISNIEPRSGDRLIFISDGVTQAGLGSNEHKLGWRLSGCADYILATLRDDPNLSARDLARKILEAALQKEAGGRAGDDITVGVVYFRVPRKTILLTGPPFSKERDKIYARNLHLFDGHKVVCGGTSADIVARELGREIKTDLRSNGNGIPPVSHMAGVDLITEGILTLTRVAQFLEQGEIPQETHGAALLAQMLRDSDAISFLVGTKINEAHQDPSHPAELEIRRNIVKRVAKVLQEKYLKEISLQYI
ncbi:MAG: SpoIIE family protein phosphatase [Syntrophotaleaceae bacterium]